MRKRVIIESPFGTNPDGSRCTPAEMEENLAYARRAMCDSLDRGEAPYASHLLYPQVYDDATPDERRAGMEAGFAWGAVADLIAVYADFGITLGMADGIERHKANGVPIEYRYPAT